MRSSMSTLSGRAKVSMCLFEEETGQILPIDDGHRICHVLVNEFFHEDDQRTSNRPDPQHSGQASQYHEGQKAKEGIGIYDSSLTPNVKQSSGTDVVAHPNHRTYCNEKDVIVMQGAPVVNPLVQE